MDIPSPQSLHQQFREVAMSEHSPEPWSHVRGDGITRCSIILHGHTGACEEQHIAKDVAIEDAERIVACVNFCQHLPIEVIEKLTEAQVGPATLAQWVRANPKYVDRDTDADVCAHCDHVLPSHDDDCLLEKALDILKEWKS